MGLRRWLWAGAGLTAWLLLAHACSGGGDGGGTDASLAGSAGGGTTALAGGSGGARAIAGGSGGATAAAEDAGEAPAGNTDAAAVPAGPVDPTDGCAPESSELLGSLGGLEIEAHYAQAQQDQLNVQGRMRMAFRVEDALFMTGTLGDLSGDGTYPSSGGILRLPGDPSETIYCAGEVTLALADRERRIHFGEVAALGVCPGTPVDGELSICADGGNCDDAVSGTLDGQPIDSQVSALSAAQGEHFYFWHSGLAAYWHSEEVASELATVLDGVIITPEYGPLGGAIYCIGTGELIGPRSDRHETHLRDLSKLADCPAAGGDGSFEACFNGKPRP